MEWLGDEVVPQGGRISEFCDFDGIQRVRDGECKIEMEGTTMCND